MLVITDQTQTTAISNLPLRQLIEQRINERNEYCSGDPDELGPIIVIEPIDTVDMVQEPEFAAREQGYTFVSHQQEVGTGYFDEVTTVIQGGSSSVKALTGSTEEEQFH